MSTFSSMADILNIIRIVNENIHTMELITGSIDNEYVMKQFEYGAKELKKKINDIRKSKILHTVRYTIAMYYYYAKCYEESQHFARKIQAKFLSSENRNKFHRFFRLINNKVKYKNET